MPQSSINELYNERNVMVMSILLVIIYVYMLFDKLLLKPAYC